MTIERTGALKVPFAGGWQVIAAIALNLIPLIGVAFWGWSAFALIFLYWLENVVIGVRTLISMAISGIGAREMNPLGVLVICAFFTVHYGIFCFGHGSFVVGMFGDHELGGASLDLVATARALFETLPGLRYGLASIVLWQILILILAIVRGDLAKTDPLSLMGAPYPRIIILHITIIFGAFLLLALNEPVAGLVVMALVKTAFDVAEARGKMPSFSFRRSPADGDPPQ
ncbi:DUF6498-containing protein [Terricaulis sp.]|uniref:DUF6498-containing protein n=1 Tax=Terricaulis sp. TaxID=2768686 RepID=UPI002AC753C1|nr:DUF6498-containing protein [Terricaulis sp.]MDZ4690165.1 DUF6498-containing protein [Terricaulis sp.]